LKFFPEFRKIDLDKVTCAAFGAESLHILS